MNGAILSLAALIPLIAGTSAQDTSGVTHKAITVALCNGGEITVDLGTDEGRPQNKCPTKACHANACHAGGCRERQKVKPAPSL